MGARIVFSTKKFGAKKFGHPHTKIRIKLYPCLILLTKINSKWIRDLNRRQNCKSTRQKKHKGKAPWNWSWQQIFGYDTKSTNNKSKNKQVGLPQTKKSLHSKRNKQQNEKAPTKK